MVANEGLVGLVYFYGFIFLSSHVLAQDAPGLGHLIPHGHFGGH